MRLTPQSESVVMPQNEHFTPEWLETTLRLPRGEGFILYTILRHPEVRVCTPKLLRLLVKQRDPYLDALPTAYRLALIDWVRRTTVTHPVQRLPVATTLTQDA